MIKLLAFETLSDELSSLVLQWRNHPDIRSFMYTEHIITQNEHQAFLNSLGNRKDKCYFLVLDTNRPIGVIDLTEIQDASAVIGLYANPFDAQKGKGSILMKTLMEYAIQTLHLNRLKAECFSDNIKAKYLYEKFDFKETERFMFKQREVIRMEYHYDHRTA